MLRPTVSKAFGAPDVERPEERKGIALAGGRWQAVQGLFSDLYEEIRQRVEDATREIGGAGRDDDGKNLPDRDRDRPTAPLRISKKRSLAEGMEFVLETPAESRRFFNTLSGVLWVYVLVERNWVLRDLISVQRKDEVYCPIWKPVTPGRAAYRFTSVRSLADAYLQVT